MPRKLPDNDQITARPTTPRLVRLCALLAAAIVAAAVSATPAAASWGQPFAVSKEGQNALTPKLAVDDSGTAFVWVRPVSGDLIVQARLRSFFGTLGPVHDISPPGEDAFRPDVAIDTDGDAVITWQRSDGTNVRIQARQLSTDNTLTAVQDLSAPGQDASAPQVSVADEGDAVFTWLQFNGTIDRVQARARAADGTLSPVQVISPPGKQSFDPNVGVDANGDAVLVWRSSQSTAVRVQTRARSALGTLTSIQTLSGQNGSTGEPEVAVDDGGDAVFTWRRSVTGVQRIETRVRSAAGVLSANVQQLSPAGQSAFQPHVGVDTDGDAVYTWQRSDGTNTRIQSRARTFSTGVLSPVQDLSEAGQNADSPQVAVDIFGNAAFVWRRFDGANSVVQARTRTVGGALGAVDDVSVAGETTADPQVGVDQDFNATATWMRDIVIDRIAAALGP